MAYAYRKKEKWALLADDSTPLTDFCYDMIVPPRTTLILPGEHFYIKKNFGIKAGSCYGVLDHSGREIIPCLFNDITELDNGYLVKDTDGIYWVNEFGKPMLLVMHSLKNDKIGEKKWGDKEFFMFENAKWLRHDSGFSVLALQINKKWGVFTLQGEQLFGFDYDAVESTRRNIQTDDYLLLRAGDRWIAKNLSGQILFELDCDSFDHTYANFGLIIKKESGYGFVDHKGVEILPAIYEDIKDDGDDNPETAVLGCLLANRWTLYNGHWEKISEGQFDAYESGYSELFIGVKTSGWGAIDYQGNWVIPPEYEDITITSDEYFILRKNSKYALYSQSGAITAFEFDSISNAHSDKVFCIEKDYRLGLLDHNGNVIIQPKYVKTQEEDAIYFFDGRAQVALPRSTSIEHRPEYDICDVYFGFIDEEGSEVIPIRFDFAHHFRSGLSRILKECRYYKNKYLIGGKYGIIDTAGKLLVPPKYDWILDTNFDQDKFILVKLGTEYFYYGWIDKEGNEYFED